MNALVEAPTPSTALTTMKESVSSGGGIIGIMAKKYQVEPLVLRDTIHNTIFDSKGTDAEFIAFLVVANEYKLNPLTREIYAFPKKGGGIVPVVSIDGWISLVNSHPQFKGMEFEPLVTDKGALYAYTCRIWRKDREMPTAVTEYLDECIRSTDPWKMKNRMLRHKTLIQCARYAFGFSGIYDDDDGAVIAESSSASIGAGAPPPPPPPPVVAKAEIEDATIISETAAGAPPPGQPAAQDAGASQGSPSSGEAPASDDATDLGINPDDEIANLIDKLAHAKDEDTIETWYTETDIEAELAGFDGDYVGKARAVKQQQIDRVRAAAAREAKAADPAPPPPPAAAGLTDDEPPAPPSEDRGFDLEGWRAFTAKHPYVGYAEDLGAHAKANGNADLITTFWKDSNVLRTSLMAEADERLALLKKLNVVIDEINAANGASNGA